MRTGPRRTLDFEAVTEVPGARATREQLRMIQTRYTEAARRAVGRRVLEVACGPGRGLGLIARHARWAVGGDLTFRLASLARRHYAGRVHVLQFDAEALPFRTASFDLVVMFEALYYLRSAERFLSECRRVLAPGGEVLLSSSNPEWSGCPSSVYVTRFYTAAELSALLADHGFEPDLRAAFATGDAGLKGRAIDGIRRLAIRTGLMPGTLAGREWLKRVWCGPLTALGPEIADDDAAPAALCPIDPARRIADYKQLYAIGRRTGARAHDSRAPRAR